MATILDSFKQDSCPDKMPRLPDDIAAEGDASDVKSSPAKRRSILWSSFASQMRNKECVTSYSFWAWNPLYESKSITVSNRRNLGAQNVI